MSNYNFMKTGYSANAAFNPYESFSEEHLRNLLSLFISNALITANKYSTLCKRNGTTKLDTNYGLKHEAFIFFTRSSFEKDIKEIQEDVEIIQNEEVVKYKLEYTDSRTGTIEQCDTLFDTEEELDDYIYELEKADYYTGYTMTEFTDMDLKLHEMTCDDDSIEPFSRISTDAFTQLSTEDRSFVIELHHHYDTWDSWEPTTPIEEILKNTIEKIA